MCECALICLTRSEAVETVGVSLWPTIGHQNASRDALAQVSLPFPVHRLTCFTHVFRNFSGSRGTAAGGPVAEDTLTEPVCKMLGALVGPTCLWSMPYSQCPSGLTPSDCTFALTCRLCLIEKERERKGKKRLGVLYLHCVHAHTHGGAQVSRLSLCHPLL